MGKIQFRIAKPSDARAIANVQYHIRNKNDNGFFAHVNFSFLKKYFEIVLNDPYEVIVCAEDTERKVVGFCSASLNVERQFEHLRKNKICFILPLLSSVLMNPNLLKAAFDRYKATKGKSNNSYVTSKGLRAEYWGWLPDNHESEYSVVMQDIMFYIMKMFGAEKLYFEVDKQNKTIFKFHKINGAVEVKSFVLPDGRERVEFYYDMNKYNFKLK